VRIEILGSAAGGGFPQWNCNCRNCNAQRAGTFHGKARTQTQIAVSNDSRFWYLLNASPDLRLQIEASHYLHPREEQRHSPIAGVVLSGADVDQVAGLLSLREFQPLSIYCTESIQRVLQEQNSIFSVLNRIPNQTSWIQTQIGHNFPLVSGNGKDYGICVSLFPLGSQYPDYVSPRHAGTLRSDEAQLGVTLESSRGRIAYLPTVPKIDDSLLSCIESASVILFDGTFWTDDELIRVKGSGPTAREMGHVPVSGGNGSLRMLGDLSRARKIFIHINNTNPMLDESGEEYQQVRNAGWEVAEDGMGFEL
jgi:pyrroloquinoline quinone biosynthesis protein B